MTYALAEEALLARVQACTGFGAANTSRGNWRILNSGLSDHYAILKRGPSTLEWTSLKAYTMRYSCMVEVWQRYVDDGISAENLETHVDNVILGLCTYPHLGAGFEDSNVGVIGEFQSMWGNAGDGPFWLMCIVEVKIDDTTIVTFAE